MLETCHDPDERCADSTTMAAIRHRGRRRSARDDECDAQYGSHKRHRPALELRATVHCAPDCGIGAGSTETKGGAIGWSFPTTVARRLLATCLTRLGFRNLPAMMSAQTVHQYFRRTRKGKVLRECVERYVRDDLQCGLLHGQPLSAERFASVGAAAGGWLVIDTNVALHQIDLLEHRGCACAALDHIVVTQTALEEVRHNNASLHRRVCALLADRAARRVLRERAPRLDRGLAAAGRDAERFQRPRDPGGERVARSAGRRRRERHAAHQRSRACAAAAPPAASARRRCASSSRARASAPTLHDMVAAAAESGRRRRRGRRRAARGAAAAARGSVRRALAALRGPPRHHERPALPGRAPLRTLVVLARARRDQPRARGADAKVSAPVGVLVDGSADINRAVDGDIVAITLLAVAEWEPPAGTAPQLERQAATDDDDDDADRADDAPAVAEPTAAPEHDPIATTVPVVPSDDAGRGRCRERAAGAKPSSLRRLDAARARRRHRPAQLEAVLLLAPTRPRKASPARAPPEVAGARSSSPSIGARPRW